MSEDIFEKIKEEHDEFKDMLGTLASEKTASDKTLDELKTEVLAHNRAEEQTLYEAMKTDNKGKEMALVGAEEHRMGESVMRKLEAASKGSEEWNVQLNLLKHLLEKHIEVEEAEVLPMAQDMLQKSKVDELSAQFESIEEKLEQE